MAGSGLLRSEAVRYTRITQAAALVLMAGAVAAYPLLPVAERVAPPASSAGAPVSGSPEAAGPEIDFQATSDGLAVFDSKHAPPEVEPPKKGGEGPTTTVAAEPDWKYLGAILEPTRMLAVVSEGGSQHLVSAGSVLDKTNILEVRADAIVIKDGTGERTIDLEPKTGAVLGSVASVEVEHGDAGDHEGEMDNGGVDPHIADRIKQGYRPGGPGSKNIPRPPRPTPGGPGSTGGPANRPKPPRPQGS